MTAFPTDRIVAVLGGTGPAGPGTGPPVRRGRHRRRHRLARRRPGRRAAAELADATGGTVSGADNAVAAEQGDVVVVAVPWDGHRDLLEGLAPQLAGKVVVDCVNPLGFDKQGAYALPSRRARRPSRPRRCCPTPPWSARSTT